MSDEPKNPRINTGVLFPTTSKAQNIIGNGDFMVECPCCGKVTVYPLLAFINKGKKDNEYLRLVFNKNTDLQLILDLALELQVDPYLMDKELNKPQVNPKIIEKLNERGQYFRVARIFKEGLAHS